MSQGINTVMGVEGAVTDFIYDNARADEPLREAFLAFIRPENPPRAGENLNFPSDEWQRKTAEFAALQGWELSSAASAAENARVVLQQVFGEPSQVVAGGSLANTAAMMLQGSVNGKPLLDGKFVAAVGEGLPGDVFIESLRGNIVPGPRVGEQLEAHVFTLAKDRIIISVLPSPEISSENKLGVETVTDQIRAATKMAMLGGYMAYTGKYDELAEAMINKIIDVHPEVSERATLALTLSAQNIAERGFITRSVEKAAGKVPVVVLGNTGEFRRMMGMDSKWRREHNPLWEGLSGDALEEAKKNNPEYQAAKQQANMAAYVEAVKRYGDVYPPVEFVVTNGSAGVRVVASSVSPNYPIDQREGTVVSTVGAGDAFAGGYLAGKTLGIADERQRVEMGLAAAAVVVRQEAPRLPMNAPREVALNGRAVAIEGLPACLDLSRMAHQEILKKLAGPELSLQR